MSLVVLFDNSLKSFYKMRGKADWMVAGWTLEGHPPLAPGQGWVVATTLTWVCGTMLGLCHGKKEFLKVTSQKGSYIHYKTVRIFLFLL